MGHGLSNGTGHSAPQDGARPRPGLRVSRAEAQSERRPTGAFRGQVGGVLVQVFLA